VTRGLIWTQVLIPFVWVASILSATTGGVRDNSVPTTRARTSEVLREYITALLSKGPTDVYFADDIVVTMVDLDQQFVGREAVEQAVVNLHQVAFTAAPEVSQFIVGSGIASAEIVFTGIHIGDFLGIPATGREVRVPYVAVWELADDKIAAIRLYGPASGLIQQITANATRAS